NLISLLVEKTNFKIISLDNYSSGKVKNHLQNKKVKYLKCDTKNISKILNRYKNSIQVIFHFGEFSRIYQSFLKMSECIDSNSIGSNAVFNFCLKNRIKLIYSATSASIGNNGDDKNLSPYAFTKSKNLEMLENLRSWFNFKFEIIYFYNVYGPNQIESGDMATVIGIFEKQFRDNKPLTVVRPGTQTRSFTYVKDTVNACYLAWRKNKCRHYSISNKKTFSIIEVAKIFNREIKLLPKRPGERYASALTNIHLSKKVYKLYGKTHLKDYLKAYFKH
ncbi:NAD-dependent epimerase/dehydratase family protein, partial [Candidatus Pelagibacter sp.]|nr:NAD-dependent epimerase/dehydratase family protein [Candidatus Pelagibacter sp.]